MWCVCGNAGAIAPGRCFARASSAILPTRKIFSRSLSSVWRSSHVFPAKTLRARRTFFVPTGTRKSRFATKTVAARFPSGGGNRRSTVNWSISGSAKSRFSLFQTRDFAKPAPGESSRKMRFKKTQIPDRVRIAKSTRNLRFDRTFTARLGWRVTANELTPFRIRLSWLIGEEREKCLLVFPASRVLIVIPAHAPFSYQTPNNNNGLHCLHLHRLGRRPQGVQGPGTSRDARACEIRRDRMHVLSGSIQERRRRERARASRARRAR